MTTSVYFDEIDLSEIEYDENSTDESMLKDPTSSITALQGLRVLKTRETGDEVIIPDIIGREQKVALDYNNINYESYKMRRKAEVLKYKKNINDNKKTQYSHLALTRRGNITNVSSVTTECEDNIIRVKPATNSGIKGDNSLLFLNPNVPFMDKL
jgi:glycosylphosphatidylinositol transamidase (GPIT) subunit GPI8